MATGNTALDHSTLDAAAGSRSGRAFAIEHLRQLLVASGALPERDRHQARLEIALAELVAAAHPEDRQVLRTYATWRVLSRLRRSADRGEPTQAAAYRACELTTDAAHFLAWLRHCDTALASCTQADLDAWLNTRERSRTHLIGFLKWARDNRLVGDLDKPPSPSGDPSWFIADDRRWDLARHAITDETLLVRDLGADSVILPPPLDQLIQELPDQAPVGMAGKLAHDDHWLFPGRRPGQPMDANSLGGRLRRLGIQPCAARNTTLLQLGAELPSIVLADLLGMHISTAERWSAAAGARWTTYAGVRPAPPLWTGSEVPDGDHGLGLWATIMSLSSHDVSRPTLAEVSPAPGRSRPAGRKTAPTRNGQGCW